MDIKVGDTMQINGQEEMVVGHIEEPYPGRFRVRLDTKFQKSIYLDILKQDRMDLERARRILIALYGDHSIFINTSEIRTMKAFEKLEKDGWLIKGDNGVYRSTEGKVLG